jgi:hypothetical protein
LKLTESRGPLLQSVETTQSSDCYGQPLFQEFDFATLYGDAEELKTGWTCSEDVIIDCCNPSSIEAIKLDRAPAYIRSEDAILELPLPNLVDEEDPWVEILPEWLSQETTMDRTTLNHSAPSHAEWLNWGPEFELDILPAQEEPKLPISIGPHKRSNGFSAVFASALVHASLFLSLGFLQTNQCAGAGGLDGNVISIQIAAVEDLIPQDESPASVDSAASSPSTKKSKKETAAKPERKPEMAERLEPEPDKVAISDKVEPSEQQEQMKASEKDKSDNREDTLPIPRRQAPLTGHFSEQGLWVGFFQSF